jgi:surface protein
MFKNCSNITSLDVSNFNTSNVTLMTDMFYACTKLETLDLSNFDTSNVVSMANMFRSCNAILNIDVSNFDTSKVRFMNYMFQYCTMLPTIDLSSFDTSNVENMQSMFTNCRKLENIIGTLDLIKVTTNESMFYETQALTNVTLKNVKKSLLIGTGTKYGTLLTNETLINTFKELWDLTGETSQQLNLSTPSKEKIANIYVKLVDVTDEMLAQDQYAGNKKPCVVCEPTDEGAMTLTEYATSKNWAIA